MLLFVYGTLMDPGVQTAIFGRSLPGAPDRLAGWRRTSLRLSDERWPLIEPRAGQLVDGLRLDLTPAQLVAADRYETSAYRRRRVRLESGLRAWVYVASGSRGSAG